MKAVLRRQDWLEEWAGGLERGQWGEVTDTWAHDEIKATKLGFGGMWCIREIQVENDSVFLDSKNLISAICQIEADFGGGEYEFIV